MLRPHAGRPRAPAAAARPLWRFVAGPTSITPRLRAAQIALWGLLAREDLGMDGLTQMEQTAIFEARRALYEALAACRTVPLPGIDGAGRVRIADIFAQLTAAEVDMIITRVWDQLRASMMRQSAVGELPFPPTPPAPASSSAADAAASSVGGAGDMPFDGPYKAAPAPQSAPPSAPPGAAPVPADRPPDAAAADAVPDGYFRNAAGKLLKKGAYDDPIPDLA